LTARKSVADGIQEYLFEMVVHRGIFELFADGSKQFCPPFNPGVCCTAKKVIMTFGLSPKLGHVAGYFPFLR
jgi:hypothetical protein